MVPISCPVNGAQTADLSTAPKSSGLDRVKGLRPRGREGRSAQPRRPAAVPSTFVYPAGWFVLGPGDPAFQLGGGLARRKHMAEPDALGRGSATHGSGPR